MPPYHWTSDTAEAEIEQSTLRTLVRLDTGNAGLSFIRGLAFGTAYDENSRRCVAVAIAFDRHGHCTEERITTDVEVAFPYVPGLLAFRVGPAICSILDRYASQVDLLLFDGQGIAHPRGLGLAAHIGVLYDKPSIGVTRNNLFGRYTHPPSGYGNRSEIIHPRTGLTIGYALSLGGNCEPCYVSPGHRIGLDDAVRVVMEMSARANCFPVPLQRAHRAANARAKELWYVRSNAGR